MSSDRLDYWMLQIAASGTVWTTCGTHEVLDAAITEWQDWLKNAARDENATCWIEGMCNDLSRDDKTIVVKFDSITAMDLTRYR